MITLSHAEEITNSKISTLRPEFKEKVIKWLAEVRRHGILPYIYEGYRTPERQDELYAQGRTKPGRIVTNAKAGESYHQYGLSFDYVPLKAVDKAEGMYEANWNDNAAYDKGREIAEGCGMRGLSWEQPHIQDARYESWRDIPK